MQNVAAAPPATSTDAGFFAAAKIVRQTGTYPRERAVAVARLSVTLLGALFLAIAITGVLAKWVSSAAAGVVFLLAVLALVFVGMPYVERRFFAMRCAFAFLVTEVLMGRSVNIPQVDTGAAATIFVEQNYGDLGAIYETHRNVRNLVSKFFRTFDRLDAMLPIDLGPLRKALAWLVDRVAPRVADLAVAHAFARGRRDLEDAGKDTVALLAQNPKPLLGMAIRAHLTERVVGGLVGFVAFLVSVSVAAFLVGVMVTNAASANGRPIEGSQTMGAFAGIFAGGFVGAAIAWLASWFVRTAWLEPVTLTMLLVRFHAVTHGQAVDPAIRGRLGSASSDLNEANRLLRMFE